MENLIFPTIDPEQASAGAVQRAQGLMHLLAVAYNAKDDSNGPPTKSEADGIIWLVSHVSEDLEAELRRVDELFAQAKKTGRKGAAQ